MKKLNRDLLILLGIIAVYLAFTAYQLRSLPGEWYGDISIENREVRAILAGGWPWRFNTSAGPAYHYVVAGFAYFLGPHYETYKLASLVTGLVVVILTFLLGRELAGKRVGLLSAGVAACAFWLIVFARLGSSPQILSPVLTAASVYFLLRFDRSSHWLYLLASMVFAGLGLFTYPSTFVLPLVVIALIGWRLVFFRRRMLWLRALVLAVAIMVPFTLWFVTLARADSNFGQAGYVGGKIFSAGASPQKAVLTFSRNMIKAVGMFQFVGDISFRTNLSNSPVLDPLSGVLMDVGLIWVFLDRRMRPRWAYVIASMLILLVPSADPGVPQAEVPSASRALGSAPFIFFLVGLGLEAVWIIVCRAVTSPQAFWSELKEGLAQRMPLIKRNGPTAPERPLSLLPSDEQDAGSLQAASTAGNLANPVSRGVKWASTILALLLTAILIINVSRYFGPYAWGLPEHNQPWGWQIAQYIDTLPSNVQVKLAACCWGAHGQPEPDGIYYTLKHPQGRESIISNKYLQGCQDLAPGKPYVIIFPPNSDSPLVNTIRRCSPTAVGQMHRDGLGKPSFYSMLIQ